MSKSRQIELLERDNERLRAELERSHEVRAEVFGERHSETVRADGLTGDLVTARRKLAEEGARLDVQIQSYQDLQGSMSRLLKAHQAIEGDLGKVRESIGSDRFNEIVGYKWEPAQDARVPYLTIDTIETSGATRNVEVTVAGAAVNALARPGDEPFVGVTPASEREQVDVKAIVEGIKSRYKHGDRIDGGPVCLDARYVREPGKVLVWEYLVVVWLGRFTIIRKGCPVVLGADGQTLYITPDDRAEPWGVVVEGQRASDSLAEGELWVRRVPSNADAKPEQPRILQTINVPVPGDTLRERLAVHVHSPKGHDICSGQLLFYDGGDSLTTEPTHTSRSWGVVTGWEEISAEPRWFRAWVERAAQ